ncbi:hypothetical protein CTRI78_v011720 [Colletotrichum trifolii]|uniref:Uncharacterized protein n=1 Tax=Colletotrichum trifolii TaxID=5466 RepID=A0A4R8Q3E4_COLTR|nr:hypothetical protein CTRI78_v011720 [Colletotrichum trifolii]
MSVSSHCIECGLSHPNLVDEPAVDIALDGRGLGIDSRLLKMLYSVVWLVFMHKAYGYLEGTICSLLPHGGHVPNSLTRFRPDKQYRLTCLESAQVVNTVRALLYLTLLGN